MSNSMTPEDKTPMPPDLTAKSLRIRDNVYWDDHENHLIILDMNLGKYFALNPAGAPVWRAVAEGSGPQSHPGPSSADFGDSPDAVLQTLLERGLITAQDRGPSEKTGRHGLLESLAARMFTRRSNRAAQPGPWKKPWLLLQAYSVLVFVDMALLTMGFHGLFTKLARATRSAPRSEVDIESIDWLCRIVLSAFRWYRPNTACMHRALGIYLFLRLHGVSAELCLGVEPRPFASHTWAEYRGRVLGDSQSVGKAYRVIARLA